MQRLGATTKLTLIGENQRKSIRFCKESPTPNDNNKTNQTCFLICKREKWGKRPDDEERKNSGMQNVTEEKERKWQQDLTAVAPHVYLAAGRDYAHKRIAHRDLPDAFVAKANRNICHLPHKFVANKKEQ